MVPRSCSHWPLFLRESCQCLSLFQKVSLFSGWSQVSDTFYFIFKIFRYSYL